MTTAAKRSTLDLMLDLSILRESHARAVSMLDDALAAGRITITTYVRLLEQIGRYFLSRGTDSADEK
jgi:hypothetical protein